MDDVSFRSPFYESPAAMGGSFMEEAGWFWTDGFGDPDAEYRGVREDLGVWDVSPLNKWEFRGPDAVAAAQRVHTNNARGSIGQVRYGALCDHDGRMNDDGTVYRLADRVWVMTNGGNHAEHFADATSGARRRDRGGHRLMPHLGLQGRVHAKRPPRCARRTSRACATTASFRTRRRSAVCPATSHVRASAASSATSSSAAPSTRRTCGTSSSPA